MYIMVQPYKEPCDLSQYANIDCNSERQFVVVDTSDATAELVPIYKLINSGLKIENLYTQITQHGKSCYLGSLSCITFMAKSAGMFDYASFAVCADNTERISVGDRVVNMKVHRSGGAVPLTINGVDIRGDCTFSLAYFLKYRDYIVMRYCGNDRPDINIRKPWYTVVVDKSGKVDYWSEDYKVATNKELAMRIDMTSKV